MRISDWSSDVCSSDLSRRTIDVGGSQTLKADYDAHTTQLFTELGYAIPVGRVSTIEPYVGLAWFSQHSQGFDETGGSAALRSRGQTDNITTTTLGLRGKTVLEMGRQDVRLTAGLGWRHASGDVNRSEETTSEIPSLMRHSYAG